MSAYSTRFAVDFAERCKDVLEFYYPPAKNEGREVTLLLVLAAGGLVVPYERLSKKKGTGKRAQIVLDRDDFGPDIKALKKLLGTPFRQFRESLDPETEHPGQYLWEGGLIRSAEGHPSEWEGF